MEILIESNADDVARRFGELARLMPQAIHNAVKELGADAAHTEEAFAPILKVARSSCPPPGTLKAKVNHRMLGAYEAEVFIKPPTRAPFGRSHKAHWPELYARFVEHGTSKMAAQPFIQETRDAVAETAPLVVEAHILMAEIEAGLA